MSKTECGLFELISDRDCHHMVTLWRLVCQLRESFSPVLGAFALRPESDVYGTSQQCILSW